MGWAMYSVTTDTMSSVTQPQHKGVERAETVFACYEEHQNTIQHYIIRTQPKARNRFSNKVISLNARFYQFI